MKKFLLYLVIAIAVVSLGLTIYYFSTDNEAIYIKSSYLVVNRGQLISTSDSNNELLDFKNRSEYTTLSYSAANIQVNESAEEGAQVLVYNANSHYFSAEVGGKSRITITTNNRSYAKFYVDVLVCDGSEEYPYIIKTEEELRDEPSARFNGTNSNYDYNLKLGNDIELTQPWTPISGAESGYSKVFDGNYFTIKNMEITDDSVETFAGFVSVLEKTGVIKNLFLEDVNIDCAVEYVGSYAGVNKGLIQTSEATGYIKNRLSSGSSYVGGIAGRVLSEGSSKAKIDRCGFEGIIETSGSTQTAGGVAGESYGGTISESYSRTFVKNGSCNFGGIVGLNQASENYTADIYDSYFYLTDSNSQTNKNKMKGIVYSNTDGSTRNKVTGNYFGGKLSASEVEVNPISGTFESSANGYLTSVLSGDSEIEFENKSKFVTVRYPQEGKVRLWNFDSVWEIPNNANYPVLNVYSSSGSVYLIDVSEIVTTNDISTAQELYDVLKQNDSTKVYKIINDISLDPNAVGGFIWGDSSSNHSIPNRFDGTIVNGTVIDNGKERPCEIKNLSIRNEVANSDVGLVRTLGDRARLVGLVIDTVTISGTANAQYVGVIAGVSEGASVYNVKINNVVVNLSGVGFGGIFGYADDYEGHGINNVTVKGVSANNSYYLFAGGLVGVNLGTIATEKTYENGVENVNYNKVYSVELVASSVGGIAGANGGRIYYANAQKVKFNVTHEIANAIQTIYSGSRHVFVGGVAGMNEVVLSNGLKYKGVISDVYANLLCKAQTGNNYNLYIGGVTGFNPNSISRAYVNSLDVEVIGSQSAFVGGLVGYNMGKISNSVVDNQSKIITPIVSSVGATQNYVLSTTNCSIVGGLVGYDSQTSNSTYSIYQCASLINKVQGYYVGGITGISFGKVLSSYCGDSNVADGGVTLTGHMIGGISSVVAGGFVKNCYAFCKLNSGSYSGGTYNGITSALNMEVRCAGGLSVFVFNPSTEIIGSYAVVSFTGDGVSYGSCADGYNGGKVKNCVYTTAGSIQTSFGTKISKANLKGADGYRAFKKAIGDTSVWELSNYPTLIGVNVKLPNDTLPNE